MIQVFALPPRDSCSNLIKLLGVVSDVIVIVDLVSLESLYGMCPW